MQAGKLRHRITIQTWTDTEVDALFAEADLV
jgi:head-tail adaptor